MAAMERESMTVDSTTWKASCFRVTKPGESDSEQNLAQGKSTYSVIERSLECSPLETADSSSPDAAAHVKLSILMAAYNEENTILKAINEVLLGPYPCEIELIVVNDGSTDNTPALLSRVTDPRVIIHNHLSNRGKGASVLSAASLATGTHILPFDADLEYAPEDITNLLKPVIKGRSDVVYGVRLFGCNTVYQSYRYAVGNKLLTRITNILFNSYVNDLHTCLKLMPLAMLRGLSLSESGFGLDTQVTALLLRRGIRPFEVPVSYYSRSHDQGKKINWRDAVRCVWILVKTRISPGGSLYSRDALSEDSAPGDISSNSAPVTPCIDQIDQVAIASGN